MPDEFIANQDKECAGQFITCTVAPDAKSYTFAVPSTKHEQKFETKRK